MEQSTQENRTNNQTNQQAGVASGLNIRILLEMEWAQLVQTITSIRQNRKKAGSLSEGETDEDLDAEYAILTGDFQKIATDIYGMVNGYESREDKPRFKRYQKKILKWNDPRDIKELFKFRDFTGKMLRNSNLIDLGHMPSVREIMHRIEV